VGKEKMKMKDNNLKILYDLRTNEDRYHYRACAYEDEHGEEIDRFLSSEWEESVDISNEVNSLEKFIIKELWKFEHDRPISTRWKPIAARCKGAIVEILYYVYKDDWKRNGGKPSYSVIRVVQTTEYIPIKERMEMGIYVDDNI